MDPDAVRHHDKAIEDFSPSEGPGPHSTGIKPPAGVFKTSSGARAQFEPINSYHCNSQSTQRRAALGRRGDCEGQLGAVRCANGRRPEDPRSLRQRNRRRGGRRSGPATRSRSRPGLETRRQAWCSGRGTELAVAAAPQQTSTRARRSASTKRRIAETIVCRPGRLASVPKPMRQSRRKPPVS